MLSLLTKPIINHGKSHSSYRFSAWLNDAETSLAQNWLKQVNSLLALLKLPNIDATFSHCQLAQLTLDEQGDLTYVAPSAILPNHFVSIPVYVQLTSFEFNYVLPATFQDAVNKVSFEKISEVLSNFICLHKPALVHSLDCYVSAPTFYAVLYELSQRNIYVSSNAPCSFEQHPTLIAMRGYLVSGSFPSSKAIEFGNRFSMWLKLFSSSDSAGRSASSNYLKIPSQASLDRSALSAMATFDGKAKRFLEMEQMFSDPSP